MALVVVDAPIGGLLYAAYVSQTFIVEETVTTGQPPAALEVVVKNNSDVLETLYYEAIEITSSGGTDTCRFKLDIREVVQQVFSTRPFLPVSGTPSGASATFPVANIQCEFTSWKPDADNFLVRDDASTEVALAYKVINAVRYEEEEPYMTEYYAATERRFLTSKPLRGWTDLTSNEYLYFYNRDDIEISWIVNFRSAGIFGALRSWGRVIPDNDNNRILRLGVGGLNMLNMVWDSENIIGMGGMGLANPNVAYYEVYGAAIGSSDAITEIRRYNVRWNANTCVAYRIHFMNKYGVFDFFPVESQPADALKISDDPYEQAMSDDFVFGSAPVTRAHVRNRGQVRTDKAFEVEVSGIAPKTAKWLQEMAMSPLAFIEMEPDDQPGAPTRFYPIVIRTSDFNISDRTFIFEVVFSRQKVSQRV